MSVGLDIGSKTVKIVELAHEGDKFSLRAAGAAPFPFDITRVDDEKELANASEAIKKLVAEARISSRDVNISLSETSVFTRVIKLPLLTNEEIASAVKWESEEYIPIPLKEAVLQYQILERREVGNPPQVLVLVVAAIKTMVEKYVSVVSNAGLRVVGVETELLSIARSLGSAGKTVMLLDFGALSTDIAITKEGQLFFSRSIPTAGEAFTRAVAQGLGVTPVQAEEYKKTYGFTPNQLEDKVATSLRPILKGVVDEMKKSIHFYQMDMHGESPNVIVVSGGSAGLPGVSAELAKMLGLEVVVANPFQNVIIDPQAAATLSNYAPLYSVSVGLAMR